MRHSTGPLAASGIRVRQIGKPDIAAIADFLARGFRTRPPAFWLHVFELLDAHPTPSGFPKYGYLLESAGATVGAIIQIFTAMPGGNGSGIRCSVSSWFVQDRFRSYASLLVSKALSHPNVTYLNVTPALHTLSIIEAQGYCRYGRGLFVAIPALQFSRSRARVTVVKPDDATPECRDFEHALLLDHARYGCLSLRCTTAEGLYPFVFRLRTCKGLPCAQLIYCRSLNHLIRFSGPLGRFLVMRGRSLIVVDAEGPLPGLVGKYFNLKATRYFRGPDRPRLGDLAYTETAMFGV